MRITSSGVVAKTKRAIEVLAVVIVKEISWNNNNNNYQMIEGLLQRIKGYRKKVKN